MRPRNTDRRARALRLAVAAALSLGSLAHGAGEARADETDEAAEQANARELRALSGEPSGYARLVGTVEMGRGLRFNNPYRLSTQLGSSAESLSLTASYLDLGAAVSFGKPDGIQHGAAVHWSLALAGVPQQVVTPTYFMAFRGPRRWLAYGRLGPSIVLTPDTTLGFEAAGGFGWFLTANVAVAGEIVGDVYYGAGTPDTGITTYPILSAQLGLMIDYEILP